ncbi:cellulase family glycosylhydrolase [Roseiconus nitratireducens]|uniref:Cellulase family glycosylhydrolase n=2 Tax=Roseiconus nitratireducens TaxID=2605748 RepID=A0A5M6D6Q3_9BACT|nr:cellulase family glycosylhydrolase [Roseiconus nitratireducens]
MATGQENAPHESAEASEQRLRPIAVSSDGKHFVYDGTEEPFVVWGVNYDHDRDGQLLDEYWMEHWDTVEQDFREIKALGANCVRIHLQLGKFMDQPDRPNDRALQQLAKLLHLAEDVGLYLDITGLACYHKKNIPPWYDSLSAQDRWNVQALFCESIAKTCHESPAVFCYDLMNEPILPGKEPATEWLGGELGGKFFVQRLSLDLDGRTRQELAGQWIRQMTGAIKRHDDHHLVTVGVIPWVFVFGGGKPLLHSPEVGDELDFVAVHFYPESGKLDRAVESLLAYEVGKPIVVEEMFPMKCSPDELIEFVRRSSKHVDGWISFYWGATADELTESPQSGLAGAITAKWLKEFENESQRIRGAGGSTIDEPESN